MWIISVVAHIYQNKEYHIYTALFGIYAHRSFAHGEDMEPGERTADTNLPVVYSIDTCFKCLYRAKLVFLWGVRHEAWKPFGN